jgi:YggT family protein
MVLALIGIADLLLSVVMWMIIIQVVLSWLFVLNVLNASSGGVRAFVLALERISAPIYRPIRKILPDFGCIDFSPLVVLMLIKVLKKLLAVLALEYLMGV